MLKNGVLVGFGPSDPKENLILSLEVEHVKSNFKSDSALHCRAISKKQYGYSPHEMASLTKWPISYIC